MPYDFAFPSVRKRPVAQVMAQGGHSKIPNGCVIGTQWADKDISRSVL
jgi:hypothetical protein